MFEKILEFFLTNITERGFEGFLIDAIILMLVYYSIPVIISLFSSEDKKKLRHGNKYENFVASLMQKYFKADIYRNILMTDGNGDETELDMAFVTTKGIFAIECKYHSRKYSPCLTGGLYDDVWKVTDESTMQNPFNQNYKHIKFLERNLGYEDIYSVVLSSAPYEFRFFGKTRSSTGEPCINMLNNEKKALVYAKDGLFQRGMKEFYAAVSALEDKYTKEDIDKINIFLKSHQMDKRQRKEFAKRMSIRNQTLYGK